MAPVVGPCANNRRTVDDASHVVEAVNERANGVVKSDKIRAKLRPRQIT